jgi:inner membrane protein YidH
MCDFSSTPDSRGHVWPLRGAYVRRRHAAVSFRAPGGLAKRLAKRHLVAAERFDEAGDATRRTRLATERTYLAWWRTGLTCLAVGFGAGRLVPDLSRGTNWPFEAIGVLFALVGVGFIAYGYVRQKQVEEALARADYAPLNNRAALVFASLGVLLGLATLALLLVHPT